MTALSPSRFEIRGEFAGFFRDVFGQRQMVLRHTGDEVFIELPKALQRELEGRFAPGQEVVVTGEEPPVEVTGRRRRIVSQVSPAKEVPPRAACPIRICANKTCWRNGGQELWRTLEGKIMEAGLEGKVALKAAPCMDLCKRGPNVEIGGDEYHHCSARTADELLAPFIQTEMACKGENVCSPFSYAE